MNMYRKVLTSASLTLPLLAYAQLESTQTLIERVGELVRLLTIVVAGIALLVFFWGLVKFIYAQGSETVKSEAKKVMGWGLMALFVMVSIWGIVAFMQEELGLPSSSAGGSGSPKTLSDGCGPLSEGYLVECDNTYGDFGL